MSIKIEGAVANPSELSFADLSALDDQVDDVSTVIANREGRAVRLRALLSRVNVRPEATHLTVVSRQGDFAASVPLDAVRDALVVYALGPDPLPASKGVSARGVVAGLSFLGQWLEPRFASEPRKAIVDCDPCYASVEEDMGLWVAVDWPSHVCENDVDAIRMMRRLAEQRAATVAAKRSCSMLRGLVGRELLLPGVERELTSRHCKPRDEGGAMASATHRAVAMTAEERRKTHAEANGLTKAGSGYSLYRQFDRSSIVFGKAIVVRCQKDQASAIAPPA